jgi:hypothetical protein
MQSTTGSTRDLVMLANRMGLCYPFKRTKFPRLYDMVKGVDSTERRGLLLRWCEEAHLKGNLFLTVDEGGSLLVMSMGKFRELYPIRACIMLSKDEKRILGVLRHALSTPDIRRRARLLARRFDEALLSLRYKMRITLVDVMKTSKTKHINLFAKIREG